VSVVGIENHKVVECFQGCFVSAGLGSSQAEVSIFVESAYELGPLCQVCGYFVLIYSDVASWLELSWHCILLTYLLVWDIETGWETN